MTDSTDRNRPLAEEGFLSPEIEIWTEALRSANSNWFALAEGFSKVGLKTLKEACAGANTELKSISQALFARCLSNFQAGVLLIERGLVVEALAVARVCLEGVIFLTVLAERKEDFLMEMRRNELDANYKLIAELLGPPGPEGINEKFRRVIERSLADIEKVAGRKKHVALNKLAESGRVRQIYGMYRHLSRDCHPTLFSINRYRSRVSATHVTRVQGVEPQPFR